MDLTKTERTLTGLAATLGTLQALAWISMSLICIILYNAGLTFDQEPQSYMELFDRTLYNLFLNRTDPDPLLLQSSNPIITSEIFTIFMWILTISHLIWLALSVLLCIGLFYEKHLRLPNTLQAWGLITLIQSCVDVILTVLLGVDFNICLGAFENNIDHEALCTTFYIPVLVISARGFVLWFINVVLAVMLIRTGLSLKRVSGMVGVSLVGSHIPRATLHSPHPYRNIYANAGFPWTDEGRTSPSYSNQEQFFTK